MLRRRLREIAPVSVEPLTLLLVTFLPLLVVTTAMWIFDDGLRTSWGGAWSLAVRVWLLGFGVPSEVTAGALAAPGTIGSYSFTLMPLGVLIGAVWASWRSGSRTAQAGPLPTVWIGYALVLAVAVGLLATTASNASARVSLLPALLLPWLLNLIVFVAATLVHAPDSRPGAGVRVLLSRLRAWTHIDEVVAGPFVWAALRGAAVTMVALVAAATIGLTVSVLGNWMSIVAVYESLHGGWTGVIIMSLTQLLYLPNLVIWAIGWVGGAGIAVGTGSLASPLGTLVAPMPAIPVLGAIPTGGSWQIVLLLLPVLAGFVGAWFALRPLAAELVGGWHGWLVVAASAVGQAVATWLVLTVLAALASGALGPGRLQEVGVPIWRMIIPAGFVALGALIAATVLLLRRPALDETANR
ncbi:hypothetical protein F8O07_09820 [Pseudoclavibacter sp. CFCC 13796]|uniref:cell division protein PerM n=1 Tax=Pseudoclavibacter sp. CFCC 13796 TaxID=2615179 RepID=UPI001300DC9A|nr:DUF6350 family protein [Pseudoclavibacter sp. CFCC 13796]KAB1659879.1 hypothetical protein F8O07_09820 [Pseudoclavibacter sp. CFCC 13796]